VDRKLVGIPASPGIAVGPVHLLRWEIPEVRHRIIGDDLIPNEIDRLRDALNRAQERLAQIRDRVERTAGAQEAAIFDVQRSILDDQELLTAVEDLIRQNLGAEKAFEIVMFEWGQKFARAAHPMLRERVGDLKDVEIRVLTLLLDLPDHDPVDLPKGANAILVTHDLTPSLTVQLDREAIAAIATDAGTRTSHVAILARSLGLPAIVGLRTATQELTGRETAILDGSTGLLAINPSLQDIDSYRERARQEVLAEEDLRHLSRQRRSSRGSRSRRAERRPRRWAHAHRVPRRWPRDDAG
jgi:phosphoenolpyruvate-protein phosphotransferase (PTS system enzyme I)